jgi:hypothetical protein
LSYAIPAIWLSTQPWFRIEHVWYLSIVTATLQMILSFTLLRREMARRLG